MKDERSEKVVHLTDIVRSSKFEVELPPSSNPISAYVSVAKLRFA